MDGLERELSRYYDAEASSRAGRDVDPQRARWRDEFIGLATDEGRRTLVELGCGPGRDSEALVAAGLDLVGVDLAIESLRLVAGTGARPVRATGLALPFVAGSFDAAWTMSTLLHIPDVAIDTALSELCRVVRPGAPIGIGLWGGVDFEGVDPDEPGGSPRFFSIRSHDRMQAILRRHGTLERFDTWDYGLDIGWQYQFAVLRP